MLKRITMGRRIPAVAGAVIVVAIIGGGTATAANLITGKDIKNGSVGTADIKNGSLKVKDLTPKAVKTLQKHGTAAAGATGSVGATGAAGARGPQGPQGPKGDDGLLTVTEPGNGFSAGNSSVVFSDSGVKFGPYDNNSSFDENSGGSLIYRGLTGLKVRDIAQLAYSAGYLHNGATSDNGDAPYLRIFIDINGDGFDIDTATTPGSDDHVIVYSPSTQPGACAGPASVAGSCNESGRLIKHEVTDGTVRYDNDEGSVADSTWEAVVNAHGSERIDSIRVSTGNSLPGTQKGFLNSLSYELAGLSPQLVTFSK